MIKQKKYAYYLIPKNFANKQKYLVYFLECCMYSVIQSEWKRFYGDVVLDNFNKASRDEDNIATKYITANKSGLFPL